MSVAAGDSKRHRIKAVAAIDPWFTPYHREVMLGHFHIRDPELAVCIVESEDFADQIDWKVLGLNS